MVVLKHALRNALVPVVALAAVQLGLLLGGSIVIETIFALDGLGYLAYQGIIHKDFPVTQAVLLLLSIAYVLLTLAGGPGQCVDRSRASGSSDAWLTDASASPTVPPRSEPVRRVRRRVLAASAVCCFGAPAVAILLAVMALAAPLLAPHDPYAQDLVSRLMPPIWTQRPGPGCTHWAPTISAATTCRALIYGARISLLIGVAVMLISGV